MTRPLTEIPVTPEGFNEAGAPHLPGLLGLELTAISRGQVRARLDVKPHHWAANGYLHAATVVALADTCCGNGCIASLPEGAEGFTTIELKSNFLGTVREGEIVCEARLVHGGRSTQVWDAEVTDPATGKPIAAFRCTQMVLYPR